MGRLRRDRLSPSQENERQVSSESHQVLRTKTQLEFQFSRGRQRRSGEDQQRMSEFRRGNIAKSQ